MSNRRRAIAVAAVLLATTMAAYAAEAPDQAAPEESPTTVERFMVQQGRILVKESHHTGTVGGYQGAKLDIAAVKVSDAGTGETVYGVKFTRPGVEKYERDRVSFLDYDEAAAALEALIFIRTMAAKMATEQHERTEVVYETRGGLQFGYIQMVGPELFPQVHHGVVSVGRRIGRETILLLPDRLQHVEKHLRAALEHLRALGAK